MKTLEHVINYFFTQNTLEAKEFKDIIIKCNTQIAEYKERLLQRNAEAAIKDEQIADLKHRLAEAKSHVTLHRQKNIRLTDKLSKEETTTRKWFEKWVDCDRKLQQRNTQIADLKHRLDTPHAHVVTIEVRQGVASVVECPEHVAVQIIDKN